MSAGVVERVRVHPAALAGTVRVPGDKSLSHRALLLGAMVGERVPLSGLAPSGDVAATAAALRTLGAEVVLSPTDTGLAGHVRGPLGEAADVIDCGNSGTSLRLLAGVVAGIDGVAVLTGDASLRRRPVDRVRAPLERMGARIDARAGGRLPPLVVRGGGLAGIRHDSPVASAQVKSCVLLAGLAATGETTVVSPLRSRDHTERMLRRARVPFWRDGRRLAICQVDELELDQIEVPGDPSSAAPLVAAALLVPGSRIVVRDVGLNWTRTGFIRIARRMGAVVVGELEEPGADDEREPVGELDVAAAPLAGTVVEPDEVPLAIDELPLVALLACFAEGDTEVRGAGELRVKESDRIAGVADGLRVLGAEVEAGRDSFLVRGGTGIRGGVLDARGDHRLAMLGAVAGLASREGVEVVGMESAAVSYPGFEAELRQLIASSG